MPLVLTRQRGERIRIGHDIVIEVGDIYQGRVRVLITAPSDVIVHREEVYARLHQPEGGSSDVQPA